MNVTLKDVPTSLHLRLREAADESGRSLNKLILHILEKSVCAHKIDRDAFLQRVRLRRNAMNVWIDDQSLKSAREEGRP